MHARQSTYSCIYMTLCVCRVCVCVWCACVRAHACVCLYVCMYVYMYVCMYVLDFISFTLDKVVIAVDFDKNLMKGKDMFYYILLTYI